MFRAKGVIALFRILPTNDFTLVNSSWNFAGLKLETSLMRTCNISLALRVTKRYSRSVNRNIFYVIGVIVVIIIVLKLLRVF